MTGADSGIGRATAVALAVDGCDIGFTWYADEDGAHRTADEVRSHGREAVLARLDASRPESCGAVIDDLIARLGGLDVFVNNAGNVESERFVDLGLEQWRRTIAIDLEAAFVCLQHAARQLVQSRNGGGGILLMGPHGGSHLTHDGWRRVG